MANSLNIPTQIATSLEPLAHGLERLLASQPLPEGIQGDYDALREHLTVTKGKSTLSIPVAFAKQLLEHLDPQELAHLFRILPRELCLYFHAARTDYKQGILNDGRFALSRLDGDGKIRPLRRICAMGGRSPDSPNQLQATRRALQILQQLRLTLEIDGKEVVIDRLVRLPKDAQMYLRGYDLGEQNHRGGRWVIAQIHPELFKLMTRRFIQLPISALSELEPRVFNTLLAIKGQAACKQTDELTLSERRLITDAGHSQTTTKGDAREKRYLKGALDRLKQLGYLASHILSATGNWVLRLKPETLLQTEPEPPNPAASPPIEPETLLRAISECQSYQELKAFIEALVRNLVKGSSTAQTPLPSVGSGLLESQRVPI